MADDIARRFLRLCDTGGMAENFDAWNAAVLQWRTRSPNARAMAPV